MVKQMAQQESVEELEKRVALEERLADIEIKKRTAAKMRRDDEKAEANDAAKFERDKQKGIALASQRPENKYAEVRKTCNHLMGGKGRNALLQGRGNDVQACVTKTKLPTGDVQIKCPRCRTMWLPAWELNFYFDKNGNWQAKEEGGRFDKGRYQAAVDEYNEMYNIRCDLEMVILPQYRWAKGGKAINREVTYRFVQGQVNSPASDYYTKLANKK